MTVDRRTVINDSTIWRFETLVSAIRVVKSLCKKHKRMAFN